MKNDPLLKIFKRHLEKIDADSQGVEQLVFEVVAEYMSLLMKKGNIPHHFLDTLESDLREEVLEMYRKMTYGHLNLKSYQASKKSKSKMSRSS